LRFATNGGEPVRAATIAAFERRFDCAGRIRPGYGLAEATLGVSAVRAGAALRVDPRGTVSCGPPHRGVEVRVIDDGGRRLGPGETGEIVARTPAAFSGYFEAEEETRRVLVDGWIHTGDIGRLDADGELYVLGRRRALIKRGGGVVAPRELEEAAERVAAVRLSAAVGLPGASGGEEAVLVAEVDPAAAGDGAAQRVAAEIVDAVGTSLGWAPEILLVVPRTIPRTENGKVRHGEVRRLLAGGELGSAAALWGDPRRWSAA
jgi:acyl-CoA synthetase (AMP-forming)/AMP-acid ligase II